MTSSSASATGWAQSGDTDKVLRSARDLVASGLREMNEALRATGRDIVFSISNSAPFSLAPDLAKLAQSWRTTGDIRDRWADGEPNWSLGISEIGFNQDRWAPHAGPGHWNDLDMLVLGHVGWGPNLHPANLTPGEQYTHMNVWFLLSEPRFETARGSLHRTRSTNIA